MDKGKGLKIHDILGDCDEKNNKRQHGGNIYSNCFIIYTGT